VRLLLVGRVEAGLEKGGWRVDAFGAAGFLEVREVGCLGGRGGSVEDGGPSGSGGGSEGGELGGVVEGIEVDVREEECGDGAGCVGGGLGPSWESGGGEQGEEQKEVKRLHGR